MMGQLDSFHHHRSSLVHQRMSQRIIFVCGHVTIMPIKAFNIMRKKHYSSPEYSPVV